ncbi:DVUA0089 family protein, partial [Nodularia spumigena CS-591/04]
MSNPAFNLIGLTQLRNDSRFAGIDGSGMAVAVIDTGLDGTHSLLNSNYVAGRDFVYGDNDPEDIDGHGTHVAGTVGAADPRYGVAPDVKLIGLKVFGNNGGGARSTDIQAALQWVIDNKELYNIVAVNMSLGAGFYTSVSEAAGDIIIDEVRRLEELGVVVVSATGNSFKNNEYQNLAAPAIFSTLAVGAVWQDGINRDIRWGSGGIDYTTGADRVTSFSQRLDAPNKIFAPGAMITSTVPGNRLDAMAGTSMASPVVAGAVALMQEAAMQFGGRFLTPSEVVQIMRSTADIIFDGDDEDDNVQNTSTNYPRLNIYNAVQEVQRLFQDIAPNGDPNGTIQGAYIGPILDGTTTINSILGSIGIDGGSVQVGDKDVDIIRFEMRSPGIITIEVSSHPENPADFDSLLRLFNASGEEIAFDDDSGVGLFSAINISLASGVYYAGISGYDNSNYNPNVAASGVSAETGNYSLNFQLRNPDPNGIISGAIPVNLGTDSEPLYFQGIVDSDPISNSDERITIGPADVDIFKLVAPDNGILLIDIDTPYDNYVDSFLRVFDEDGNELFFSDDDLAFNSSLVYTEFTDNEYPNLVFPDSVDRSYYEGHTTDSFIGLRVDRGQTYYIGVSDYDNQTYNPNSLDGRSGTGTGGLFDLTVQFFSNDQNGSITQALKNNYIPINVTNLPGIIGGDSNLETREFIEVGDRDVDFFKINSPNAGILEIDIKSYGDPTIIDEVDAVVFIYDREGNLLALNDDRDTSLDPLLRYQITANTDYFVAVTGYGNDSFNPFQLGSGSSGDTGEYKFNSRLLPLSQITALSNNTSTSGTVENVSVGSIIFGNIGDDNGFFVGASDIDIYRFTPTTTARVTIRASANEAFNADTFLRVFNANGTEIAFNDDENALTRGSGIQIDVTAGTQYLIGVNGASPQARNYNPLTGAGAANGSQGDYILSIFNNVIILDINGNSNEYALSAASQNVTNEFTISADKTELGLSGNTWKKLDIGSYN